MTTKIHHLNCGSLHKPPSPKIACHCVLFEEQGQLAMIDTGIGWHDVQNPLLRIGPAAIEAAGYLFNESDTAIRQIQNMGFDADDVKHIYLTHGHPDHAGGLSDFPNAIVHISELELCEINKTLSTKSESQMIAYSQSQLEHGPRWRSYCNPTDEWFGLPAHRVLHDLEIEIMFVELPGHTDGHCGVAYRHDGYWYLHAGDTYFLRDQLFDDDHPVNHQAAKWATSKEDFKASLRHMKRLLQDHCDDLTVFSCHDFEEFYSMPSRLKTHH